MAIKLSGLINNSNQRAVHDYCSHCVGLPANLGKYLCMTSFSVNIWKIFFATKGKPPSILFLKMTVCILQCVSAAVGGFSGKINCHRVVQGLDYYQMVPNRHRNLFY